MRGCLTGLRARGEPSKLRARRVCIATRVEYFIKMMYFLQHCHQYMIDYSARSCASHLGLASVSAHDDDEGRRERAGSSTE
jgi:hypothetical protein